MTREDVQEMESLVQQSLATLLKLSKVKRILSRNQSAPNAKTLHLMAKAAVTVLEATESEEE